MIDAFEDWKHRADDQDLIEAAKKYGAVLKRAGRESSGPCPGLWRSRPFLRESNQT
jgi:hypothetical protein